MLRIASAPLVPSSTQGPGRSAALTAGEARNESPQDIANEIAFSKISPHKRLSVYSLTARSRPARTSFAGNASGEEQCQCNANFQNPSFFWPQSGSQRGRLVRQNIGDFSSHTD